MKVIKRVVWRYGTDREESNDCEGILCSGALCTALAGLNDEKLASDRLELGATGMVSDLGEYLDKLSVLDLLIYSFIYYLSIYIYLSSNYVAPHGSIITE